jgi:hypothetical protein
LASKKTGHGKGRIGCASTFVMEMAPCLMAEEGAMLRVFA